MLKKFVHLHQQPACYIFTSELNEGVFIEIVEGRRYLRLNLLLGLITDLPIIWT